MTIPASSIENGPHRAGFFRRLIIGATGRRAFWGHPRASIMWISATNHRRRPISSAFGFSRRFALGPGEGAEPSI